MSEQAGTGEELTAGLGHAFLMRVFHVFAALALASLAIALAGKWIGHGIANGGHSEDTTLHEIWIGSDTLAVPANAIRFDRERRDGPAARLDLYLRWPDLTGYSKAAAADFNNVGGRRTILFLSFEARSMSRDMSGRFEPIYRSLIVEPGMRLDNGVVVYAFKPDAGYMNEELAVAVRPGDTPFVARCLTGAAAAESAAPCERDIALGNDLSATYRFPRRLLDDWRALDAAVVEKASAYLKAVR